MTDLFETEDVRDLLKNKTVVFLGGSIIRGLYKDVIWLLNSNSFLPQKVSDIYFFLFEMKINWVEYEMFIPSFDFLLMLIQKILGAKGEKRFPDFEASEVQGLNQKIRSIFSNNQDVLHYCGEAECDEDYRGLLSGRQYRESREYSNPELQVQIYYR